MFCAGLLLSIADLLTHDWPSNKHSAHATACSVRLPACRRNKGGHPAVPVSPSFHKAAPPADSCEYHTASCGAFQLTFSSASGQPPLRRSKCKYFPAPGKHQRTKTSVADFALQQFDFQIFATCHTLNPGNLSLLRLVEELTCTIWLRSH